MASAASKRPNLGAYYGTPLAGIIPGDFEFRLWLVRSGIPSVEIRRMVTSFSWTDEGDKEKPYLTGDMTCQRPNVTDADSLPIGNGHRVRCEVRGGGGGGWYILWTMRVQGVPEVDLGTGVVTVTLADDLDNVRRGRRRWRYRKTRHHKHGWLPQQITRDVARKLGLKVGSIVKGKHRTTVNLTGTGFQAISKAYAAETEHTGVDYWLRLRNGKLDVVPFKRNTILYVLRDQITQALVHGDQPINPVTVIKATGRVGKGKKARKVKYTAANTEVVRRFGRVEEDWDAGKVSSRTALKTRAKRRLAKKIRVTRTADLQVPGVPFIRRADGLQWITREPGWYGGTSTIRDRSYVYVTYVKHSVSEGLYTTDFTVQQDDPYQRDQARKDAEKRKKARERRKNRKKK